MPRLKQHRFVDMQTSLVNARVGDHVSVSTDMGIDPTRYEVTSIPASDSLHLRGIKGAKRTLVIAASSQEVWLYKAGNGRRVVQAWLEPQARVREAETFPTQGHVLPQPFHAFVASMFEAVGLGEAADGVSDFEALAILGSRVSALADAKAELDKAHAALGRQLAEVEADRAACRTALGMLRNVASGLVPVNKPLPSNTAPIMVVVEVTAAMHREAAGQSPRAPIRVSPDFYRGALDGALPERMRGETANGAER
jgi:hypothetical protein